MYRCSILPNIGTNSIGRGSAGNRLLALDAVEEVPHVLGGAFVLLRQRVRVMACHVHRGPSEACLLLPFGDHCVEGRRLEVPERMQVEVVEILLLGTERSEGREGALVDNDLTDARTGLRGLDDRSSRLPGSPTRQRSVLRSPSRCRTNGVHMPLRVAQSLPPRKVPPSSDCRASSRPRASQRRRSEPVPLRASVPGPAPACRRVPRTGSL